MDKVWRGGFTFFFCFFCCEFQVNVSELGLVTPAGKVVWGEIIFLVFFFFFFETYHCYGF